MTIEQEGIETLLARPDFFPLRMDTERRAFVFVQMSRETFRRSSFLDHRAILATPDTRFVGLEELTGRLSPPAPDRPAHFILHGAFCGSTLLARFFDELPHCLTLKEPQLLAQLAMLGNADLQRSPEPRARSGWFDAVLTLLARGNAGDAAVVIKAPDQFNWLASRLLDREQRPKIIYLCAPLRVFLLSALKSEERRAWLRSRGRGLRRHLVQVPLQHELVVDTLTDGQLGAALWLLNSFLCLDLLAGPHSEQVLVMCSEDLIAHPRETFQKAVEFFGLTHDEDIRSALAGFRSLKYYSKEPEPSVRFDAATRAVILEQIEQRFGREVDAAIDWARGMSAAWLARSLFPVE